ncbi:MAG: hypothetical protein ACYTHM_06610 [Planctomycetota bacterium]|jgi:hypothetical protein
MRRILPAFICPVLLVSILGSGFAQEAAPGDSASYGPYKPLDVKESKRQASEKILEKLSKIFDDYRQKILDAKVKGMLGGTLPPGAKVKGMKWPDPVDFCMKINRAGGSRGFRMRAYSYKALCILNRHLNKRLEKGGYHAYLSEKHDKGRVILTCIAGELLADERGGPPKVWGKPLGGKSVFIGRIVVRYPGDAYREIPSFTSDREVAYHFVDLYRHYAKRVWNRLKVLEKKKVDFGEKAITEASALAGLKGLEPVRSKMAFTAWRVAYQESKAGGAAGEKPDADQALARFTQRFVGPVVADIDIYERVQLQDIKGLFGKKTVWVRTGAGLAQVAHAANPMDCLRWKVGWLTLKEGHLYRAVGEKIVEAFLAEADRMKKAGEITGVELAGKSFPERLSDVYLLSPEDLRKIAKGAFEKGFK